MLYAPGFNPTNPGIILVSPSPLAFTSAVAVGKTSAAVQVKLTNSSNADTLSASAMTMATPVVAFSDPSFSVVSGTDTCSGQTIALNASCTFSVQFSPVVADVSGPGNTTIKGTMYLTGLAGTAQTVVEATDAVSGVATEQPASTPASSLAGGSYSGPQKVTLSDTTPGAVIYYTTNGTTPTTSSTVYSAPITVSSSETVKAIAVVPGYTTSAVWSATYTITTPITATPTIGSTPSCVGSRIERIVSMGDTTSGAAIYFTIDGTTPTTSSTHYTARVPIATTTTFKVIAVASGYVNSAVATATIVPSCGGIG